MLNRLGSHIELNEEWIMTALGLKFQQDGRLKQLFGAVAQKSYIDSAHHDLCNWRQVLEASVAALEQLQAPCAEWAASAATLAQQLSYAIAALAPQQVPAAQVEISTQQLHPAMIDLQPASGGGSISSWAGDRRLATGGRPNASGEPWACPLALVQISSHMGSTAHRYQHNPAGLRL